MSNLERIEKMNKVLGKIDGILAELSDNNLLFGASALQEVRTFVSKELKSLREDTFGKGASDGE